MDGMHVRKGMKVGDLDSRIDFNYAVTVSEKSLAVGGGVLEAVLTKPEIRSTLWN
jgi:xanthine dehydrogenase accessory factor